MGQIPRSTERISSYTKNPNTFWGGSTASSPSPFSVGKGHPSPYLTLEVPPLELDPGYATGDEGTNCPSCHQFLAVE